MLKIGIFGKVFLYTLLFLVLVVGITIALFSRQFIDYYNEQQFINMNNVFQPLRSIFENGDIDEVVKSAADFHSRNQSFDFTIQTGEGKVVFRSNESGASSVFPSSAFPLPTLPGAAAGEPTHNTAGGKDVDAVPTAAEESATKDATEGEPVGAETAAGEPTHNTAGGKAVYAVPAAPEESATKDTTKGKTVGAETAAEKPAHNTVGGKFADAAPAIGERTYSIAGNGVYSNTEAAETTDEGIRVFYKSGTSRNNISMSNRNGYVRNIVMSRADGLILMTTMVGDSDAGRKELYKKIVIAAVLILALSILGAIIFARGITKPIKQLANDAMKMAALEEVTLPKGRADEVGRLEQDVHNMYNTLKKTIGRLEDEIGKVKGMEESQRYFFSMASHELKTPIAAASVLLEGMLAGVGDYTNHPKYLRECMHLMQSQNKIVTEILEIVKLSGQNREPFMEEFGLRALIEGILPDYKALAEDRAQNFKLEIPDDIRCFSDRTLFARALSNIIMNGIQNSPEGEEIRIWADSRLYVFNTGAAIGEADVKRLFEPFFRLDEARSRVTARSGLGLTIVSQIFNILDINYSIENVKEGVLFTLDIPRRTTGNAS